MYVHCQSIDLLHASYSFTQIHDAKLKIKVYQVFLRLFYSGVLAVRAQLSRPVPGFSNDQYSVASQ